eukprot:gene18713-25236_t
MRTHDEEEIKDAPDDEEEIKDAPDSDEDPELELASTAAQQQERREGSEVGTSNAAVTAKWPKDDFYDMGKREPLFSHAERSCFWELTVLASHAHPSVAAFSRTLMSGAHIVYDGDPLKDAGLSTFLDKFLLKKPKFQNVESMGLTMFLDQFLLKKSKVHAKGSSLMQPLVPARRGETQADADVFFHKFYNLQSVRSKKQAKASLKKKKGSDSEDSEAESDGELSDDDVDAFLDRGGNMMDEGLEDPDGGYDYDELEKVMGGGPGSSDDGEDAEAGSDDGEDVEAGSEDEEEVDGDVDMEGGSEDETDFARALEIEDSGSDGEDDADYEMAVLPKKKAGKRKTSDASESVQGSPNMQKGCGEDDGYYEMVFVPKKEEGKRKETDASESGK